MNSNHIKRIDFTKSVEYDDKEDIYYVKLVTTGEKYKVNRLKDNNHGFAHVKDICIRLETPRNANIHKGLRVIDQLYKKIC